MKIGAIETINAVGTTFDITPDMMGKRIVCYANTGKKINLPSPSEVGNGAMVEIMVDTATKITEIYTPSGKIYKGSGDNLAIGDKCYQPAFSIRKYISNGSNWTTNFENVSKSTGISLYIDETVGSDTEPIYDGNTRVLKSLSQLKYFREHRVILLHLRGTVTLTENIYFDDCDIRMRGGVLVMPSGCAIYLNDVNLRLNSMTIKIDGVGFNCSGKINGILGDYHGLTIQANSDAHMDIFQYVNTDIYNYRNGCSLLTLTFCRCNINANNLTEFTHAISVIKTRDYSSYSKAPIFIDTGAYSAVTKAEYVYWHNGSNTTSRIGTSTLYTVG